MKKAGEYSTLCFLIMNLMHSLIPRLLVLVTSLWVYPVYAQNTPPVTPDPTQKPDSVEDMGSPRNVQALFLRATRLAQEGRDEEALQAFQNLIERYPELPESYNNLAALYAKKGQYAQARATLETAINANPNYPLAYQNLGTVYIQLAIEAYKQAATRDKRNLLSKQRQEELQTLLNPNSSNATKNLAAPSSPKELDIQ